MKRVVFVIGTFGPYRISTWNAFAQHVDELYILLCAERDPNRVWKIDKLDQYDFRAKIVPGKNFFFSKLDWGIYLNPSLWQQLNELKPKHIMVTSYDSPSYLLTIAYAKIHRIPLTIWWESHAMSSRFHSGPIAWVRRTALSLADSFVTGGSLATNYLVSLGIPIDRIVTGINTVDVANIGKLVDNYRMNMKDIQRRVRFLYVGQFIERKGIENLLLAFGTLPNEKVELTLVGYGPLEARLKNLVNNKKIRNVTFAGATKNLDETTRYLANADVLVMPSIVEVWGLVVNEGLAAGLYVLSSKYAGVTQDLILNAPVNVGRVIDPLNIQEFARVIEETAESVVQRKFNWQEIAAWGRQHTPERYGDAIAKAIFLAQSS